MQATKDRMIQELRELSELHGGSGSEQLIVKRLFEKVENLVDAITVDSMGNLYARITGETPGPNFAVMAHSDEISSMVKHIDPSGFIRIDSVSGKKYGHVEALLFARMVSVNGKFGVVGVKPGHLQDEKEKRSVPAYEDLYIDVGAQSETEAREMGIEIGSPVTYVSELQQFVNPDLVCGKAVDNRLGCVILLELIRYLSQNRNFKGIFHAAFTVQEEVGLRGAQVATYSINPDFAFVLDTIPCGGTPDVPEHKLPVDIRKGPVIPLAGGDFAKGHIAHTGIKDFLVRTAKENKIPYQLGTASPCDMGTTHLVREGVPTGGITIPRRYSHSPVEMADMNDALNALRLAIAVCEKVPEKNVLDFFPHPMKKHRYTSLQRV